MGKASVRMAAVIVLFVGPAWSAPQSKPEAPTPAAELERMQGTWVYESQVSDGRDIGPEARSRIWVEVEGDILTKAGAAGGRLRYKVTVDPAAKPRAIDLVSHQHPSGKTFTHKGIYEWDGEVLRMCFDNTGAERPKNLRHRPAGTASTCPC